MAVRFCIVAPLDILEYLDSVNLMGNSHLLLAHDVAKDLTNNKRYYRLFNPALNYRRDPDRLVILDNSVVELGGAVDYKMIMDAANAVQPSCIALPDVMENGRETASSCRKALQYWHQKLFPYIMIPQGKSIPEFVYCAEQFKDDPEIKYWGVPRNLVKNIGTRRAACQILTVLNPNRPIHMMGFSNDMIDDILVARDPINGVYSIDSAVPLRYNGKLRPTSTPAPRGGWWDHPFITSALEYNLNTVRKEWFRDPQWADNPETAAPNTNRTPNHIPGDDVRSVRRWL